MGYALHIIRVDQAPHAESNAITIEEWLGYVSSDVEMRLEGKAVITSPKGETIRWDAPGLTEGLTLVLAVGERGSTTAEVECLLAIRLKKRESRCFQIAEALGAIVRGDEGEHYDSSGNHC
jgi:hypothetical protein